MDFRAKANDGAAQKLYIKEAVFVRPAHTRALKFESFLGDFDNALKGAISKIKISREITSLPYNCGGHDISRAPSASGDRDRKPYDEYCDPSEDEERDECSMNIDHTCSRKQEEVEEEKYRGREYTTTMEQLRDLKPEFPHIIFPESLDERTFFFTWGEAAINRPFHDGEDAFKGYGGFQRRNLCRI
jgi:hypothetical protein